MFGLGHAKQLKKLRERVDALEKTVADLVLDRVQREKRREQTRAAREASPMTKPRVQRHVEQAEALDPEELIPSPPSGLSRSAFKSIAGGQS